MFRADTLSPHGYKVLKMKFFLEFSVALAICVILTGLGCTIALAMECSGNSRDLMFLASGAYAVVAAGWAIPSCADALARVWRV